MIKPETKTEVEFFSVLDAYGQLLKGKEHIGYKDADELRRHLVWYTTEELRDAEIQLINVIERMTNVIIDATSGKMRNVWAAELGDCARKMTDFGDILFAVFVLRYN